MVDETDLRHLRRAVDLAARALDEGDEPFGSVLVAADGTVLFEDHNHVAGGDATPMIVLFAATFPERVAGLILWDPFPTYIRTPDLPWLDTRAEFEQAVADTARALEDPQPRDLREGLASIGSDEDLRRYWRVSRLGTSAGYA